MRRHNPAVIALALALASLGCSAPSPSPGPNAIISDEPPLNLGFSRPIPAGWRLISSDDILLAVPSDWNVQQNSHGSFALESDSRDASMRVVDWGHDSIDQVVSRHYVQSSSPMPSLKKLVLLGARPSAELRSSSSWTTPTSRGTYEGRTIVTQLGDQRVVAFSITSEQRPSESTIVSAAAADRQEVIAAYAMPMRDVDRTFTRGQIEHTLGRAGTLMDARAAGVVVDAVMYEIAEETGAFVLVSIYPNRVARARDDPNATGRGANVPGMSLPISSRAIGNVVVLVAARDVTLRYRMLVALDDLLSLPR